MKMRMIVFSMMATLLLLSGCLKSEFGGLEQQDVFVPEPLNPNCNWDNIVVIENYPAFDTSFGKPRVVDRFGDDNAIEIGFYGTRDVMVIQRFQPDRIVGITTASFDISQANQYGFAVYILEWNNGSTNVHQANSGNLYMKMHKNWVLEVDWCDAVFVNSKTGEQYKSHGGIKIEF